MNWKNVKAPVITASFAKGVIPPVGAIFTLFAAVVKIIVQTNFCLNREKNQMKCFLSQPLEKVLFSENEDAYIIQNQNILLHPNFSAIEMATSRFSSSCLTMR